MRHNRKPSTVEDRDSQAKLMYGCSAVILALCLGVAMIIAAWRIF